MTDGSFDLIIFAAFCQNNNESCESRSRKRLSNYALPVYQFLGIWDNERHKLVPSTVLFSVIVDRVTVGAQALSS